MSDLFNFKNEQEECLCEACQLTDGYLELALECETVDELRAALRSFYEDAFDTGYENALRDDIDFKLGMINHKNQELM